MIAANDAAWERGGKKVKYLIIIKNLASTVFQHLAFTVLHVPYSIDSGRVAGPGVVRESRVDGDAIAAPSQGPRDVPTVGS